MVLWNCNDNSGTKKKSYKRRKTRQGNCSHGDDGFNKVCIIQCNNEQAASKEAMKAFKGAKNEITRIEHAIAIMKQYCSRVASLRIKNPNLLPYYAISQHTHHDVLAIFYNYLFPMVAWT
eukprot:12159811-Ditylum_brightwellii.AAC.2